jgi:cardiolipin synthase A/B
MPLAFVDAFFASIPSHGLWIGTVLHFIAVGLVLFHSLMHRKESSSFLVWVFLAWSFPFVGAALYVMFGVDRIPAKGWRKRESNRELGDARQARADDASMPLVYWQAIHEALAAEPANPYALETHRAMNRILEEFPLLGGNRIEPLVDGTEAYPAMLRTIRAARHHIHLQTYIIGNDAVGRQFMEALHAKAQEGVRVRLLYDRFGSARAVMSFFFARYARTPNLSLVAWTQANPLKRAFQINARNHRKLLVVDGREAFTGGLNLHDENLVRKGRAPIRDYHFHVCGPIVQEMQYAFMRDWYFATDEDAETLLTQEHFPHIETCGPALIRVVNGGPETEDPVIADTYFEAIVGARKNLLAVTPYFVPTPDLVRAFRSAALRGVETRLLVPAHNNHFFAGMAGRSLYEPLLAAGVRIFERPPPFLHAKALMVDDALALVGTANLDARSLRLNYESNLAVYDEAFIGRLKRIVLEDIAASREMELAAWRRRPLSRKIAENFCMLLSPVL